MWFKKQASPKPVHENAYSVLNKELERLHILFSTQFSNGSGSEKNLNAYWNRITSMQDALLQALEKQPAHSKDIRDLQETVAELLLLTNTESK